MSVHVGWARFCGSYVYPAVVGMSLLLVILAMQLAHALARRTLR